jgi:uncharacterized protein (UPF0333 family)
MNAVIRSWSWRNSFRRGQAALEYILVFVALFVAVTVAVHFMRSPRNVARYNTDVICSERL